LNRLTPQEQDIVQVSFDSFSVEETEKDEQGEDITVRYITTDKLQEAFDAIGAASDIADISLLLADVDENGDGKIDYDEWMSIMSKKFLGEDDDASIVHVFSMLDDNKDGYIPLVEFRSLLMREGQAPLSEQEVDELLMFADVDSDGLVNYRGFLTWIANPYEVKKRAAPREPPATAQGRKVRDRGATKDDLRGAAAIGDAGTQSGAPLAEFGRFVDTPAAPTQASRKPTGGESIAAGGSTAPSASEGNAPPAPAGAAEGGGAGANAPTGATYRATLRAHRQAREKEKQERE
jgi:calmodulin